MKKLTKKQVDKFLKIRSKEITKTLDPDKFEDQEHLGMSARLIAWCDLILALDNKLKA